MPFNCHIGIDYSGAKTPTSRLKGLQVYVAHSDQQPQQIMTPAVPNGKKWNWTRKEIAEWLIDMANGGRRRISK